MLPNDNKDHKYKLIVRLRVGMPVGGRDVIHSSCQSGTHADTWVLLATLCRKKCRVHCVDCYINYTALYYIKQLLPDHGKNGQTAFQECIFFL